MCELSTWTTTAPRNPMPPYLALPQLQRINPLLMLFFVWFFSLWPLLLRINAC